MSRPPTAPNLLIMARPAGDMRLQSVVNVAAIAGCVPDFFQ